MPNAKTLFSPSLMARSSPGAICAWRKRHSATSGWTTANHYVLDELEPG